MTAMSREKGAIFWVNLVRGVAPKFPQKSLLKKKKNLSFLSFSSRNYFVALRAFVC
jgi:hypothetical protein